MNEPDAKLGSSNVHNKPKPWGMALNTYCMLLHLSQLASFIIPGVGLILPVVMWATNKDEHSPVHLHGLIVINWMLSSLIYFTLCFFLSAVIIGIPMMIVLGVVALVFAIVGAVKANEGKYWPYPLSIDFFGVKNKLASLNH